MTHRTIVIIVALIASSVIRVDMFADEVPLPSQRYIGATGQFITAFDDRTDRWLAEMDKETIEVTLQKLTDAAEYLGGWLDSSDGVFVSTEEGREETSHRKDIRTILSNRRFRKAYEDLQKIDKTKAAKLLIENIRINLVELKKTFQEDIDTVSKGNHKGSFGIIISIPDTDSYRSKSHPDHPPTHLGRKYAMLSYVWLAALLELRDVRPAIEEVIQLARDENKLFNSLSTNAEEISYKKNLYTQSLYNPSLLLTATLCDPTWNAEKRKSLETKIVTCAIVDYQARAIELDLAAIEGLVPVVPHNQMLEIRHYQGITDEEFNTFF